MNSSDTLLRAAVNRLRARLGDKIVDIAAEIAVLSEDAPDLLKKEWELFKEEIYEEANRLENEMTEDNASFKKNSDHNDHKDPLSKIDQIRATVSRLNNKVDEKH